MYLVNCTAEQELCAMHDIRGFPIITTFRGLGWMGTSNCMSQKAQEKFKNYVRLDYHGVILVRDIYCLFFFFFFFFFEAAHDLRKVTLCTVKPV